ncbi:hypothetical protein YH65_03145 [Sulfurovum lithotrophicum]|uniref:Lipoprotein n=1 Tax=Sulfurovum lithotrophicum TaxID=206403 RepID=A0A7U4RQ46_9BACT|nr:hypothetical protein [Sulfurovum lithotrophicum]AKF24493.1 hypothetical protein YH65_03145 [Sulfurovum lithotrophicum]
MRYKIALSILGMLFIAGCTQETQNSLSRSLQNWTGTNGVLDIYAGDKLVHKFVKIDKVSTAYGTNDGKMRPYRYGYGIDDVNLNGKVDPGEKKVYFEFSDYSTSYIFYERNTK